MIIVRTMVFGCSYFLKRSGASVEWTGLKNNAIKFPDESTARAFCRQHLDQAVFYETIWYNTSKVNV